MPDKKRPENGIRRANEDQVAELQDTIEMEKLTLLVLKLRIC